MKYLEYDEDEDKEVKNDIPGTVNITNPYFTFVNEKRG